MSKPQNQSFPGMVATAVAATVEAQAPGTEAVHDVIPGSSSAGPTSSSVCPGCAAPLKRKTKHYGAAVCEACKAFFRRTFKMKIAWPCQRNTNCVAAAGNAKRCKACRYKRCLNVGMRADHVKPARGPRPGPSHQSQDQLPPPPSYSFSHSL